MKGLQISINFGSTVNAAKRAKNIAEAVKIPKYMVGIKLEKIKIENPKMIVIVVKNTAFPIFE